MADSYIMVQGSQSIGNIRLKVVDNGDGTHSLAAALTTGDIELGAAEIKDGVTDQRAKVLAASTPGAASDPALVVAQRDATPAGANLIGKVGFDQTTPGTTNKVSEASGFKNITANDNVKSGAGALLGIFVAAASASPTIKVWDNTSAATTVLVGTFTPSPGTFYPMPAKFATGLYVSIGGTVDCTVFYD